MDRLKMDAVTLVAASQSNDAELAEAVLQRHENPSELTRAVADVAALLAGAGTTRTAVVGFLDYLSGATHSNGSRTRRSSG